MAINKKSRSRREVLREALNAVRSKDAEPNDALYRIEAKKPADCSASELEQFVKLVMDGGEVIDGLNDRIRKAASLAMMYSSDEMIGTAAVKRPYANYRNKVFGGARTDKVPGDYPFELGWIYIAPKHRGKGKTEPLIKAAMDSLDRAPVFATTRENNQRMHHVLKKTGFVRSGVPYVSQQDVRQNIVLFLRNAAEGAGSSAATADRKS